MPRIEDYQLFLFDFDGLLVNTEHLHYQAYQQMCRKRGAFLSWSFFRYCQAAHRGANDVRDQIYAEYPDLKDQEPSWEVLYAEKKEAYKELIQKGNLSLMPGVQSLLNRLHKTGLKHGVVTHSAKDLVDMIRLRLPVLNTISFWFTREDYTQPKPHPECYLKAIKELARPQDRIIGFEDTPRGIQSLLGTRAEPVLICPFDYPEKDGAMKEGVKHFSSFETISWDT